MPIASINQPGFYPRRFQRVSDPKGNPPPEMIQLALSKILATRSFAASARRSRFLRFTVEEALAGRSGDLKQYSLGLEVFDRNASFDPNSDPIVRVAAVRVRANLKAYYENEGKNDAVIIEFPRGYAPVFRWRDEPVEMKQSFWRRPTATLEPLTTGFLLSIRAAASKLFGLEPKLL